MQELTDSHRPSSSLFDRLVKEERETARVVIGEKVSRRQRASQLAILRSQIERDLLTLFGTRRISADIDLSAWPRIETSVLNYGVPDLSGTTGSSINTRQLQRQLTDVIKWFEPRLQPDTLNVTCKVNNGAVCDVVVEIEALFGIDDDLESFAMGISICLQSGQCSRRENGRVAA